MKKVFYLLLAMAVMSSGSAYGQDNRKTVAVVPASGEGIRQSIKDGVTEGLLEGIVKAGKYRPVARDKDFEKVLGEMKFQLSGLVDDKQLIQFGKALRADYVCYASVNQYSERGYRISYKMINVATAEILAMDSESVQNGIDGLLEATDNIAARLFGVDTKRAVTRATWLTADGCRVYQNGRELSEDEVRNLMMGTDALGEYLTGLRKRRIGNAGIIGTLGMLVGGLMMTVSGDETTMLFGLTVVLLSWTPAVFTSDAREDSKMYVNDAVNTYNNVVNKRTRAQLHFGATPHGIGLALKF